MAQRHDSVRNLLTSFLGKVCTNVEVEPQLQHLDYERFNLRSAVTSPEVRLDMKAGGFWSRGVTAFFDVRVTHVYSDIRKCSDVEMGSFTPLGFGTNGGMGADCSCFLKRLAEKISETNEEPYRITITWIRTMLSFEILRSVHTCVRGSRTPFHKILQGDFYGCHWRVCVCFRGMVLLCR